LKPRRVDILLQAIEEKERKKEEKRLAREQVKGNDQDEGGQSDNEESETPAIGKKDLNVGADAIASLSAKIVSTEIKARPEPESDAEEESDEEDVPALVNRDLPTLQSVLDASDVVLQVLDARDPLEYRSQHLESVAKEKGLKFALVLNKIGASVVSPWVI
jgi:nuclear GTP-binding protein